MKTCTFQFYCISSVYLGEGKNGGGSTHSAATLWAPPAPSGCFWHLPLLRISQYCKIRKFKVKISGVWDQDKWCLRSKLQTPWSWFQTPWSRKWVSTDWRIWSFSSSGVWRGEWCNIRYSTMWGGVFEKAGPNTPKASVKFGSNTTRRSRVVFEPNFTLAWGVFGSQNNETSPKTTRWT